MSAFQSAVPKQVCPVILIVSAWCVAMVIGVEFKLCSRLMVLSVGCFYGNIGNLINDVMMMLAAGKNKFYYDFA